MPRKVKPVILGIQGTHLTDEEKNLLSQKHILGFILFRRNIESVIEKNEKGEVVKVIQNKEQLISLINELKTLGGEETVIAIDQEGGRVRRLTTPTFEMRPSAKTFGDLYEQEGEEVAVAACRENFKSIGKELRELGIKINFAPVADLRHEGAHDIIGDRSFSSNKEIVTKLCEAALEGMKEEGVIGVIKHIPGHGRSKQDSHKELPKVDDSLEVLENTDFVVYKSLSNKAEMAMPAHIIFKALDEENPVTLSEESINYIRENLGFKGILVTDALEMEALSKYTIAERAVKSLEAGCQIALECSGKIENMEAVLNAVGEVDAAAFEGLFC
jgi:beta-glucosidase